MALLSCMTVCTTDLAAGPRRTAAPPELPTRVRRLVLHVLGGPSYGRPERRWLFFTPAQTFALWRASFGAHWIVWTDGSLWPRHPGPGQPLSRKPPLGRPADMIWRARLVRDATPVYSHLYHDNSATLGIELAHSGRSDEAFPEIQVRSLAWLLTTLLNMSNGRLTADAIVGHKDRDQRPAYESRACARPDCPVFVDERGRPFRRRVDPPESLFRALLKLGLDVPRPAGHPDADLQRAEKLPPGKAASLR